MSDVLVIPFRHGPFWNFSYLVACTETREAVVIDPAWDVAAILAKAAADRLTITTALVTHGHSDHANGLAEIVDATGAAVGSHVLETGDLRAHFPGRVTTFGEGDGFRLGRHEVQVLHTPGHSRGSVSYACGGALFTGDTLSIGSPGTPGAEAGAVESLWESARKIAALQGVEWIYPGHDTGPAQRGLFADELERNPALLAVDCEQFRAAVERTTGRRFRE